MYIKSIHTYMIALEDGLNQELDKAFQNIVNVLYLDLCGNIAVKIAKMETLKLKIKK